MIFRPSALAASLLSLLLLATACAPRPIPRVARLGDGVFKAPTKEEAEAYCRNSGDPTRFVEQPPGAPRDGFVFRCD